MTESSHAVFLSYASQDAAAAAKICDALRAAGIEVWFDKSELRGGDVWDQSIRRQIKNCALFIPVISKNTDARPEGYFRLEWKLAVDRSHLFTATRAFLVPVVIDDTPDDDDQVPDRFRELQWTRMPAGETPLAFVERVQHLLSGEVSKTIRALPPVEENASRSKRVLPLAVAAVIAAALLLALGTLGLAGLFGSRPSASGAASIAVLPLANESGEASEQYFSDGISEDLITALSQLQGLKVIGRSSAFKFRDSKDDSRSIGSKLGVAHLLEGSVRKSGDMVRVSAALINAADGSTQWSQRYDRPYKDLFALQDEITHAVASALKTRLLPGEHAAQQSERPPGGSLDAYDALLQARFYGLRGSEADIRKAIEYNAKAIALDPNYALAWSNLSIDWTGLGQSFLSGTPAQEAQAKARAAADRALALAPDLAQAHIARADVLLWNDFNWAGAAAEFRRALELAPDEGRTKVSFALSLATLGNVQRAIELTREALATDPLRAAWYNQLARYSTALNRLDEAERALHQAMELQPTVTSHYELLTVIEIQRGDAQAALAAAQRVAPGARQDVALASARQIGPDRGAADAALKTLIQKYAGD
ncbi:MAG TPA: TIR domain-containing protein, partial [Polyangiaceae bacterium]|nr:TIR domain-containing protein [Polyangiaceae bacterium]